MPNVVGFVLGTIQMGLYQYYKERSKVANCNIHTPTITPNYNRDNGGHGINWEDKHNNKDDATGDMNKPIVVSFMQLN